MPPVSRSLFVASCLTLVSVGGLAACGSSGGSSSDTAAPATTAAAGGSASTDATGDTSAPPATSPIVTDSSFNKDAYCTAAKKVNTLSDALDSAESSEE